MFDLLGKRVAFISCTLLIPCFLGASVWNVIDASDGSTVANNTLRWALINAQSGDTIQIDVASSILLNYPLPPITQQNLSIVGISASPAVIDGQSSFPIFSVVPPSLSGSLSLTNITLQHGGSYGGNGGEGGGSGGGGGGGGAGGGGLYLHQGANVTLNTTQITSCFAKGGAGGGLTGLNGGGGGGGFGNLTAVGATGSICNSGGNGTVSNDGGGGGGGGGSPSGGFGGSNGNGTTGGISGLLVSGGGGGGSATRNGNDCDGGGAYTSYTSSPNSGGNGNSKNGGGGTGLGGKGGTGGSETGGGIGGAGIGVDSAFGSGGGGGSHGATGGSGGAGAGGGGGAYSSYGGVGGAAGGGGGGASSGSTSSLVLGGNGGFGGGGGGSANGNSLARSSSLFGGGRGGNSLTGGGGGGGGAAMGGNVFIQNQASLTIQDGVVIKLGNATGGPPGTQTSSSTSFSGFYGSHYGPDIFLRSGGTLNFANSGAFSISSAIQSNQDTTAGGGLTMNGTGTVTLASSSNSFTGSVTINSGTLAVAFDGCLGNTSNPVLIGTATLQVNTSTTAFSSNRTFTLTGNSVFNVAPPSVPAGQYPTLFGVIGGSGSFTKTGLATLALTGANTYTGGTVVQQGALQITADSALGGSTGSVSILDGASLQAYGTQAITSGRSFSLSGNATINTTNSLILTNSVSGSGSLIKTGSSTLTLQATNSYSGSTTISQGTLQIQGPSNCISSSSYVYIGASSTLALGSDQTILDLTGLDSTSQVNLGSFALTFGSTSAGQQIFPGQFIGSGNLIKQGSSNEVFQGSNASYTGNTFITDGILTLSSISPGQNCLPSSPLISISSGATLALGSDQTIQDLEGDLGSFIYLGAYTLTLGSSTTQTCASVISDILPGGFLTKQGTGTLILTGNSTYQGGTTLTAGTLQIGQNTSIGVSGLSLDVTGSSTLAINYSGVMDHSIDIDPSITLTIDTLGNNPEITAPISGTSSAVTKVGLGTLSLSTASFYTGPTTILEGELLLEGALSCIPNSNLISIQQNATLSLSSSQTISDLRGAQNSSIIFNDSSLTLTFGTNNTTSAYTFAGVISDGGNQGRVIKQGVSTAIFKGANSYTGGTQISGGTLSLVASGSLDLNSAVEVDNLATFDISQSSLSPQIIGDLTGGGSVKLGVNTLSFGTDNGTDQTFSGIISGGGAVIKKGTGKAIFTGANSYTNGTTISSGTLSLEGSGSLAATGSVIVNGAFDISDSSSDQTIGDLSGSGTIELGNNTLNFGTNNTTPQTFSGTIADTGGGEIFKQYSGTAILTGNNTYQGGTTLAGGTLQIGQNTSIGVSSAPLFVTGNSTFAINYSDVMNHFINIDPSITLTIDTLGNNPEITAAISGASSAVTKAGLGTLSLSASSTYSGATTISAGTLLLTGGSNCIPNSNMVLIASGASLSLGSSQLISALTGSSGSFIELGANTLSFGTASNQTFSGQISDGLLGGSILKQGSGTQTLTGSNTYTGSTILAGGGLLITKNEALGASSAPLNVTGSSNLTLSYSGTMSHPILLENGSTLTVNTSNNSVNYQVTFSSPISESLPSCSISKIGGGTLELSTQSSYTGATTISAGTLLLSGGSDCIPNSQIVTISSGANVTLGSSQTIQDFSGASGSFVNLGANTLTFGTGNNKSFQGIIQDGGLSGSVVKQGAGNQHFWGANTYKGGTTISGGTLTLNGQNGSLAPTGFVFVASGAIFDMSSLLGKLHQTIGDLKGGGDVLLGPHVLTFGTSNDANFDGEIMGSGAVIKQGSGIASFTGNNSYLGGTTIASGTLSLEGLLGALAPSGAVSIHSGATFDISSSGISTQKIGDLTGSGLVKLGSNTLEFGTALNRTFSGEIQGSGGILKKGTGRVTLTGVNTFTGDAIIDQGTLVVNGSLASAATVRLGATLQGTGSIGGLVTVEDGGTIRPGNSIGTLSVENLTLSNTSNTYIEMQPIVNSQPTISSSIQVGSAAIVDGILVIDAIPGFYPSKSEYIVISAGNSLMGTFDTTVTFAPGSQVFTSYQILYNTTSLPYTVIFNVGIVQPPVIDIDLLKGNENGQHLAEYLNNLNENPILGPVVYDLSILSKGPLNAAVNSISPARSAIQRFVSQNTLFLVASTVSCRMSQQRLAMRDLQLQENEAPKQFWVGLSPHNMAAKATPSQKALVSSSFLEKSLYFAQKSFDFPEESEDLTEEKPYSNPYGKATILAQEKQRHAFWAEALGEWIYQDGRHQNPAYAAYTGGGLLGIDYYGKETGLLGAAIGYVKSRIQEAKSAGKGTVDYYAATLYGTFAIGDGYIELGMAGSFNQFYQERNVTYPQSSGGVFDAIAVSSSWGVLAVPHLGGGCDWNFDWGTVEPFISFDCAVLYQSDFTEKNAYPLNMYVPKSWSELLRSELGVNVYQVWKTHGGSDIILRETFSWVNKRPYHIGEIYANIVGFAPGFSLNSFTNVQNFFSPGFQFLFRGKGGGFFSLSYMGEFQASSNNNYTSHNALGQVGIYF